MVAVPLLLALMQVAPPAAAPDRPNIIYIMADDLGYAELGCYGQSKIRTPNIDRIAREGIRFTSMYAGSPVCAPSRCTLLTGLHTGHAFIRDNREIQPEGQIALPAASITLAERLKELGYATGVIGKWGLGAPGSEGDPLNQGFDFFFGYYCQRQAHNHYPVYLWRQGKQVVLDGNRKGNLVGSQYAHDLMATEVLDFVHEHRERPFFLYVPFHIPHLAIQVPADSLAEYESEWEDPPYEGDKGYLPHSSPRAGYAAMVTRMDRDIGRLLDLLEELDLTSNTLVVFTSDNGPTYDRLGGSDSAFFQSTPFRGLKGSLYDGGIRVPWVARWPDRIPAGGVTDLMAASWDIIPTLLEAAGGSTTGALDGVSLMPTLQGTPDKQPQREYLYWEFPAYGGQQAIRFGNWKAVRQRLHEGLIRTELYNLAVDPAEATDVAGGHPEVVARAESLMRSARRASSEFPFKALDSLAPGDQ